MNINYSEKTVLNPKINSHLPRTIIGSGGLVLTDTERQAYRLRRANKVWTPPRGSMPIMGNQPAKRTKPANEVRIKRNRSKFRGKVYAT